jgi:hypothetical protein
VDVGELQLFDPPPMADMLTLVSTNRRVLSVLTSVTSTLRPDVTPAGTDRKMSNRSTLHVLWTES